MTTGESSTPSSGSSPKRRGLGRGLSALIVDTRRGHVDLGSDLDDVDLNRTAPDETRAMISEGVLQIALDLISPNPQQPRGRFDAASLEDLATSIRTHGILQPLIVTMHPQQPERYWLIAGERRWRAARLAMLETVPVIVREASPLQLVEWALVENVQRADLNALEEAAAYQTLIEAFGLTQAEVGQRVGKSRAAVANTLRLLGLPREVQEALLDGELSAGHARALLALPDHEAMRAALQQVLARNLSVRQTEDLVRHLLAKSEAEAAPAPAVEAAPAADTQITHMENRFRAVLGTRVNLNRNHDGSGRLTVHFFSDEELSQLYLLIAGEDDF